MKLNSVNNINNNYESKAAKNNKAANSNNPNFKGLLDVPGMIMTAVENGGFATSFLIQDMAGMTAPRCYEGLYRGIDKEDRKNTKFKDMNFKEGAEVFIREALSGPVMMFSPMVALALGRKYVGKSTFTNSAMIKRLGNKLTDVVKGATHETVHDVKKDFYKKNIEDIVRSTTKAKDKNVEAEFVNKAVESFEKLDRYDEKIANATTRKWRKRYKKAQERARADLLKDFNDFHKSNSSDLDMVNRVNYDGQVFSTGSFVDGMRGYAHDALKGKEAADITEQYTNNVKTASLVKRALVNVSAIAATIGSLSVVPKIYKLVNPVPPGAMDSVGNGAQPAQQPAQQPVQQPVQQSVQQTAQQPAQKKEFPTQLNSWMNDFTKASIVPAQMMPAAQQPAVAAQTAAAAYGTLQSNQQQAPAGQVAFKGKLDVFARHFEFSGNQFTPMLMTGLAATALIPPRVRTAIKRAPEDPVSKKKDRSEVKEVLARDITSTGAVTFGVPLLSNAIIGLYENKTGFVLKKKPEKPLSTFKKALNLLNPLTPFSYKHKVDLDQIYGNVDTKAKLNSFSEFIDNNGGSLAKIYKTEKKTKDVFSKYGLNIDELASAKDRKSANKTIMDKMKECPDFTEKLIGSIKREKTVKLKNGTEKVVPLANNMLKRARSLNSVVSFAATFFLVPAFLGIVLPRMVYGMTAKSQKAMKEARNSQAQQPVQQPAQQVA